MIDKLAKKDIKNCDILSSLDSNLCDYQTELLHKSCTDALYRNREQTTLVRCLVVWSGYSNIQYMYITVDMYALHYKSVCYL